MQSTAILAKTWSVSFEPLEGPMLFSTPTIVWQNENFLVADKPPEWLSVPGRQGQSDTRPVAGLFLQDACDHRLWPVNRLDYEVSGLLLFAFNPDAHRDAGRWFEAHTVQKSYETWTDLCEKRQLSPGQKFEWTSKILRGKKRAYEHGAGKLAKTRTKFEGTVMFRETNVAFWTVEPLTGRSHQIRYEMARQGFPVVGDELYGSKTSFDKGIALRAVQLDFSRCDGQKWNLPSIIRTKGLSDLFLSL